MEITELIITLIGVLYTVLTGLFFGILILIGLFMLLFLLIKRLFESINIREKN